MGAALDALSTGARWILGRPLTMPELDTFDKYLKLLQKWQRAQRLIGSADERWIIDNLFLDSLLFCRVLPDAVETLADVGSGAGIPGIPIKIVRPRLAVALIESRQRRASFLSAAIRELGLTCAEVVTTRMEEYASARPQAFDVAVMRCAGDLSRLIRAASSLVAAGGLVVASGPPAPRDVSGVQWVQVARPGGGHRWFAVYRPQERCDAWNKKLVT